MTDTTTNTPNGDSSTPNMHIDPHRACTLSQNFTTVLSRISSLTPSTRTTPIRLIAVSKLKPANDILHLHRAHSHLYFGENYAQELQQKAEMLPKSVRWCFIGALQTNKCKGLARDVRGLWCVSSVDSEKKASELEKGRRGAGEATDEKAGEGAKEGQDGQMDGEEMGRLRVHVQVNTSGEKEKSGVEPEDAAGLCKYVRGQCPHLQLAGLMTIGAIARSEATTEETENEDFVRLREVRDAVVKELGLQQEDIELSMGMSNDFESAIRCGSDEVRIGSTIFGERPPKKDAKVKEQVEEPKG